jgi:phosphate transport system ATP-binding protein
MNKQASKIALPNTHIQSESCMSVSNFHVWIKEAHILNNIQLNFPENKITCIVGPSGSGKSTLIRSLNRINDDVQGLTTKGKVLFEGQDIYDKCVDVAKLRSEVGMVFQKPCIFPKSISENVVFGVQQLKKLSKADKEQIVEESLKEVALWDEVSMRLNDKASALSIGQQQRLCIARTLALKPKVILLDEPTSSLDPVSTRAIEDMMLKLKEHYTLVFVTHNIQQAKRIADNLVFVCDGKVIEQGQASRMFYQPASPKTAAYLNTEYCEC